MTTTSKFLGKELEDTDSAPLHSVAKNGLVRSKSFLQINTPQDLTKEGGIPLPLQIGFLILSTNNSFSPLIDKLSRKLSNFI